MCLAIPARVEAILLNEFALVEVGGIKKEISTSLVPDVKVGDYVIIHVGFALNKLDEVEALKTLEMMEQINEIH
ncbi:MAG: hydrogenase assembly protein HupF [Epsilonproteobacteria bacterium]|nr:MAG: hydrogenase assembly protein HupF [Campylobacterota bacterium]RLA66344.1 MAG: hydrogenase assembly protein HupF [Campylobacterota bacterium]